MRWVALIILPALLSVSMYAQRPLGGAGSGGGGGGSSSGAGGVYAACTISANAITCTPTTAVTSYTTGLTVNFTLNGNNSGATTIAVSGLAAKNVFLNGVALTGGNFPSTTAIYSAVYDGTEFILLQLTTTGNPAIVYSSSQTLSAANCFQNSQLAIFGSPATTVTLPAVPIIGCEFHVSNVTGGTLALAPNGVTTYGISPATPTGATSNFNLVSGALTIIGTDGTNYYAKP